MDIFDSLYTIFLNNIKNFNSWIIPYLRRLLRFIALPYAYIVLVNWKECKASRYQVFKDFMYIFFILKDFPDYYTVFRFWEKNRNEWKYYYGSSYNPHQRGKLRKEVQKREYEILFEDKNICNQLMTYANLPVPEFLGFIEPYEDIVNRIKKIFQNNKYYKIIIKAARGKGGKDIFMAYKRDKTIYISDSKKEIELEQFRIENPSIIQKYIRQHPELDKISSSVNTIRTETLLTKSNEVIILGAFIRFGLNDNFIDNQGLGGLSIGVNLDTGSLYEFALNGQGEKFYQHPDTGFVFKGYTIPYWDKVIELSKKIQNNFPYFKLLGPDIAISPEGPIIIEINATPDHAGLEMDYGPILKNKRVWEEFNNYGLLINKPSKNLYK